jgi:AcrR family transcriptional regulator
MAAAGQALSGVAAVREHDGDGRAQLAEIQRARIVAAMVEVVAERGVGNATVARVVARSGVSRRTFYEHFEDREGCFLAAFEHAVARIAATVVPAYRSAGAWRERVRAALAALLEALAYERGAGRLAIVEALGAGPAALERRGRVLAEVIAAVDRDGREAARGETPPPLSAEGAVGGAFALIHARMAEPGGAPPIDLLGALVATVVLPYLGPAAARRELELPAPAPRVGASRPPADPLRRLDMRLTYRTLRVLHAVGELAEQGVDPSNRRVADAAGIRDQGQISKLLARLLQLGLVHNTADPRVKGEPNAWALTERGEQVRGALSGAHAQPR